MVSKTPSPKVLERSNKKSADEATLVDARGEVINSPLNQALSVAVILYTRLNITVPLVPPKPKELDMAISMVFSCAL